MKRLLTQLIMKTGKYFGSIALSLVLAGAIPAHAKTWKVTSSVDDVTNTQSLRYAVAHATNGDTILLTADIATPILLTNGDMILKQNVTIKSVTPTPPTISGGGASRIFEINHATVTLCNLNFTDGNGVSNNPNGETTIDGNIPADGYGGAILVDTGGALSIIKCSFTQDQCSNGGGAIELVGNTLTVANCSFVGGDAWYGTAIQSVNLTGTDTINISDSQFINNGGPLANSYLGGAFFPNRGTYTCSHCDFNGNSGGYGSAIGNEAFGNVTVSNCTLENNTARFGGAIYNNGPMLVTRCTLSNNSASIFGGAVYNNSGTLLVNDCTLSDNTADANGGAIYNLGTLTFTGGALSGNSATGSNTFLGPPYGDGGAIYNTGNAAVTDCTLSDNSADVSGGGIYILMGGTAAVADCKLSMNSASVSGGGIYLDTGSVAKVSGCDLSDNSAAVSGGGISTIGTLSLDTNAFHNSTPNSIIGVYTDLGGNNLGGPANSITWRVTSSIDDVTNVHSLRYAVANAANGDTIQLTTAITTPIVLTNGDLVLTHNVTIKSVAAAPPTISGGGASRIFEINHATVTLNNLNFTAGAGVSNNPNGDTAKDGYGGAILVDTGGALSISKCSFTQCQCSQGGGAIELYGNTLTVANCSFVGGDAIVGTAIDSENPLGTDTINITDSQFMNNGGPLANSVSGGAFSPSLGAYICNHCDFSGNSGEYGSAILNRAGGNTTVTHCTLENNSAGYGGAMYNNGVLLVTGCTLSNNSASVSGGAFYNNYSTLSVNDCTLRNNTADANGGAIRNFGSLTVSGSTLSDNSAFGSYTLLGTPYGDGGAIYNTGYDTAYAAVTDCNLTDNSAGIDGGGIYNDLGSVTTVNACKLSDNVASVSGGGIFSLGTLSLDADAFNNNAPAPVDGLYSDLGGNIFH